VANPRVRRGLCVLLGLGAACSTTQSEKLEATYGPSESVVEVVAVLRRHVPDDTYRFPPATDFTGRNVYRSSLLRLEIIERIQADPLRSGYMDPVIDFAKARALERLRAYDLARLHYLRAAERESELRGPAQQSASVCDRLSEAVGIGVQLENPLHPPPLGPEQEVEDPEKVVAQLEERVALLSFLYDELEGSYFQAVIAEEIERADEVRAGYFVDRRNIFPDGQLRAVAELQRVIARHAASKNRLRHMIALANLYAALAREYVKASPPESLDFDPAEFQDLVEPAAELYESVAAHDGTPEKLEAARRLEALLAFTLQVDGDRFSY
jgi:hypothetical protein